MFPKKTKAKRVRKPESWPLFLLFIAILVAGIHVANTYLIKTDAAAFMTLHEIKTTADADIAFVGSSVVRNQFNPEIVSRETGKKAINVGIPCLGLQGMYAVTDMMYDTCVPELTVLVVERDTFCIPVELPDAQQRIMPQLTGPLRRLRYYLELCSQDGEYFNRLFLFKQNHADSPDDIKKTLRLHFDPEGYLADHPGLVVGTDSYAGRGFVRTELTEDIPRFLRDQQLRPGKFEGYPQLQPYAKRKILEYKKLCESHGSRLLVLFSPNLIARTLAEDSIVSMKQNLKDYLGANGIEYYDFALAKPELLPDLTPYYLDYFHVNADGADILSASVGRFIAALLSGEDVSGWFYATQEEYLATIDYVTNVYADICECDGQRIIEAGCVSGPNVTPVYSFALVNADGSETPIRGEDTSNTLAVTDDLRGKAVRIYARGAGGKAAMQEICVP